MLVYPQLATGASAQYPARKVRGWRTVVNAAPEGRRIRASDPGGHTIRWELSYSGLIDEEAAALEEFYRATEGRLRTFTFLDPLGNLLAWSEKLDEAEWERDPLITLDASIADPLGTQRATRIGNTSSAAQAVRQTLAAPGERTYCFSLYARSAAATASTLVRGSDRRTYVVGTEWARLALAGQSEGSAETIAFGLEIGAGASVEVFGLQVEAQIGASGYRRTWSRGGVYSSARFADDSLRITAEGVNQHSCVVHIEHANHI